MQDDECLFALPAAGLLKELNDSLVEPYVRINWIGPQLAFVSTLIGIVRVLLRGHRAAVGREQKPKRGRSHSDPAMKEQ